MQWNRSKSKFILSQRDLEIMEQCGMGIQEILGKGAVTPELPPLWSVLSFEMLRVKGEHSCHVWKAYRESCALLRERDSHYRVGQLRKNTGGVRYLRVPDWELYSRQHFLLQEVLRYLPVSESAYAYRKGIGIRDCAARHVDREVLIHMDIKDFFGSIREEKVFECILRETGYPRNLANYISRICCCRGSLPQGACTSPMLSNICFRVCDEALEALAREYRLVYTRYSDDLYFSGSTAETAEIIRKVTRILQAHGFRVNREKTKVLRKNSAQRVLGLTVNERLQTGRIYRRELRQELYYLERYGSSADGVEKAGGLLRYLYRIKGKISYVLAIDPENEEFRSRTKWINEWIRQVELEQWLLERKDWY